MSDDPSVQAAILQLLMKNPGGRPRQVDIDLMKKAIQDPVRFQQIWGYSPFAVPIPGGKQ